MSTPGSHTMITSPFLVIEGDIWKEVDPRAERFVRVITFSKPSGKIVFIKTCDTNGVSTSRNPIREAKAERFNGKRGGYELWTRDHRALRNSSDEEQTHDKG